MASGCRDESYTIGDGLLVLAGLVAQKDHLLIDGNWSSLPTGSSPAINSIAACFNLNSENKSSAVIRRLLAKINHESRAALVSQELDFYPNVPSPQFWFEQPIHVLSNGKRNYQLGNLFKPSSDYKKLVRATFNPDNFGVKTNKQITSAMKLALIRERQKFWMDRVIQNYGLEFAEQLKKQAAV